MTSVTIETSRIWATLEGAEKEHRSVASNRESIRLQRANDLDRNTLAAIYDEYHPPIYRYIYRQIGDVETARDLTAEVFRRFLQAIQNGSGPTDHLQGWLYRVAHNTTVDYFRRDQYRQHLPLKEELLANDEDPSKTAEAHVTAEKVRAALGQLTPDQQQVISLKFLEGLSNKEVADITGKPIGAIKSLQYRALASLQRMLAHQEEKEVSG